MHIGICVCICTHMYLYIHIWRKIIFFSSYWLKKYEHNIPLVDFKHKRIFINQESIKRNKFLQFIYDDNNGNFCHYIIRIDGGTVDIYSVEYTVFVAYMVMSYHAG